MRQIQVLAHANEYTLGENQKYDPTLCKTCQKFGYCAPEIARVPYSDCEEHFQKRIRRLLLTGVRVLSN